MKMFQRELQRRKIKTIGKDVGILEDVGILKDYIINIKLYVIF